MLASKYSVLFYWHHPFVSKCPIAIENNEKVSHFCLFETSEKITLALCLSDIDLDLIGLLKVNKTILNVLAFVRFISSM